MGHNSPQALTPQVADVAIAPVFLSQPAIRVPPLAHILSGAPL